MKKYCLAVDIGASSGRHILGSLENGKITLEEVYRFENGMEKRDGQLCWNTDRIFSEIVNGLKECAKLGKIPVSMSIDTWGVDFVLLDENDTPIGPAVGYRDSRTDGMDEVVSRYISPEELYERTGIQKAMYNTIYQLVALREQQPELLENAAVMLMTPDYYQYRLTGVKKQEYTIATTSQLVSVSTGDWDRELINSLSLPERIFLPIEQPGTFVGRLLPDIAEQVGFDLDVVMCGSHDTASAVLSVPSTEDNTLYISSGTWSLLGVELKKANSSPTARAANLSNEGGYGGIYRFLKNIMGLWMIQSVRKEIGKGESYSDICAAAAKETIGSVVNCNDDRFLAPDSMTQAICDYCAQTGQQQPETLPQFASVIYNSLAVCYAHTIEQIESITGAKYSAINIIGGGSNADYLNELTARHTGRTVYAGPSEATAVGNIMAQMLRIGLFSDIRQARQCVIDSFGVTPVRI